MMKKNLIFLISIFTLGSSSGYSQYAISYGAGVDALTGRLGAEGMTVIHAELYCDHHNYGTYQGLGELGIDTGIVLSNVPVHANRLFGDFSLAGLPGILASDADTSHMPDEDLRDLVNGWNGGGVSTTIFNTCALTIDFVPHYDSISFDYVYADYMFINGEVDTGVAFVAAYMRRIITEDCLLKGPVIAALLSGGSEYPDPFNIATIPGHPDIPVNAYTIFMSQYADLDSCRGNTLWADSEMPFLEYYRENFNVSTEYLLMDYFRYAGLTTVMHPVAAVSPCDTYSLKLAVASSDFSVGPLAVPGAAVFLDHLRSFGTEYDSCTTAGVSDLSRELGLAISPNPFTEQLRLDIGSGYADRTLQLSVSDITGRILFNTDGNVTVLNKKLGAWAPGLNPGMYFISVQDKQSGHRQVFKAVKQ